MSVTGRGRRAGSGGDAATDAPTSPTPGPRVLADPQPADMDRVDLARGEQLVHHAAADLESSGCIYDGAQQAVVAASWRWRRARRGWVGRGRLAARAGLGIAPYQEERREHPRNRGPPATSSWRVPEPGGRQRAVVVVRVSAAPTSSSAIWTLDTGLAPGAWSSRLVPPGAAAGRRLRGRVRRWVCTSSSGVRRLRRARMWSTPTRHASSRQTTLAEQRLEPRFATSAPSTRPSIDGPARASWRRAARPDRTGPWASAPRLRSMLPARRPPPPAATSTGASATTRSPADASPCATADACTTSDSATSTTETTSASWSTTCTSPSSTPTPARSSATSNSTPHATTSHSAANPDPSKASPNAAAARRRHPRHKRSPGTGVNDVPGLHTLCAARDSNPEPAD